jgi:hypothetical protein
VVSKRQFHHLPNLGHLLAASTNIIVPNFVQISFLILPLDWIALGVDDGILRDDAVLCWVGFDHLELDRPHTTANEERIALADWAIGFEEVGLQVDFEDIAS